MESQFVLNIGRILLIIGFNSVWSRLPASLDIYPKEWGVFIDAHVGRHGLLLSTKGDNVK